MLLLGHIPNLLNQHRIAIYCLLKNQFNIIQNCRCKFPKSPFSFQVLRINIWIHFSMNQLTDTFHWKKPASVLIQQNTISVAEEPGTVGGTDLSR